MWVPFKRLRQSEAVEVEQFYIRVVFVVFAFAYTYWLYRWESVGQQMVVVLNLPLMAGLTYHFLRYPQRNPRRVAAGVVIDQTMIVAMLAVCDERAAALFFMSATASVGYGLRFGSRYAVLSAVVSAIGLIGITIFMPLYRANVHWMVGIIGTVCLGPLYSAYLSRRIERSREAEHKAARLMRHKAYHDDLTGLPNKAAFMETLRKALRQADNRRLGLAVLFIDLDGFKRINDTRGHAAGDGVLQQAARSLRASVRSGDAVARLGGDEFVVLMRNLMHEDEVAVMAQKLALRLHDPALGLGASVGVASYFGTSGLLPSAEELVQRADTAMYVAKRQRQQERLALVAVPGTAAAPVARKA